MTPAGWIFMIVAVGSITSLLGFCIYKVLKTPDASEHFHSPADIDTGDGEPKA